MRIATPMPAPLDKQLIRERFCRCRGTYDEAASVQRRMAAQLVSRLVAECGAAFPRILEVGCGTGLLTRHLLKAVQARELWMNDLVPECRENANRLAAEFPDVRTTFLPGDIESIPDQPDALDLIISNATLQWAQDLPALLHRFERLLVPNGVLAFGTFGPENLREIRALTGAALTYPAPEELHAMLPPAFRLLRCEESRETLCFESPRLVLEHLRGTGSNGLARQEWTRRELGAFSARYNTAFPLNGGVQLTYHPMLVIARK